MVPQVNAQIATDKPIIICPLLCFNRFMSAHRSFTFYLSSNQFLRDQASDREEVVTPLMLDGTYLSRNYATLGPMIRQPPCES